jgi:hypothetical protein
MDAYPLLVCRDIPQANTETAASWVADLGDRKQAEVSFTTESERNRVAIEALNLGYRVQFVTLDDFKHESGVARLKGLCASYYGDSGAGNPTCQMEYETAMVGHIIGALEEAYQFEA